MKETISRAEARFLKLDVALRPVRLPVQQVTLSKGAQQFLIEQSRGDGSYRSGPLFGEHQMGRLTVQYAAPSGVLVAQMKEDQALELDPQYVLGYSAALRATHPKVDWVGHWVGFPEGMCLGSTDSLLLSAEMMGLMNAAHPVLLLGKLGNHVTFTTHTHIRMEPEEISVVPNFIEMPEVWAEEVR